MTSRHPLPTTGGGLPRQRAQGAPASGSRTRRATPRSLQSAANPTKATETAYGVELSYVRARVPSPLIRTPTVRVTDLQQNEPINLTVAQIDQRPVSQMFLTVWFVPHNET